MFDLQDQDSLLKNSLINMLRETCPGMADQRCMSSYWIVSVSNRRSKTETEPPLLRILLFLLFQENGRVTVQYVLLLVVSMPDSHRRWYPII